MKYNFVPVFDTKMKKRRSIAPHLAKDANYLLKMGFELIECAPDLSENTKMESNVLEYIKDMEPESPELLDGLWVTKPYDTPKELIEAATIQEKPKRGRPKKQS